MAEWYATSPIKEDDMVRGPMSEDPRFRTLWEPDNYPYTTESPVRFVPVTLGGELIGYVWAAITDDAIGYVRRAGAGSVAFNAGVEWVDRFRWAKANKVPPLQVLRQFAGQAEDPLTGYVPEGAEQEAPDLDTLKALAAAG
jgi:hypothetical protein